MADDKVIESDDDDDDDDDEEKGNSDLDEDFMSDDEEDGTVMQMDEHGQPLLVPKSPPKLPRKMDTGAEPQHQNKPEVGKKLTLHARLVQTASARLRAAVLANMGGNTNEADPNSKGWTEVIGRLPEKSYSDVPVKPGDHFIICKGHNANSVHLQEGPIDVVVFDIANCMLQTHITDLDMIVKAILVTEKDTQLSANTTKKRWAKKAQKQNKGKAPIIKMRVFTIHIGLANESEELGEDEENPIIEILDDLF
eukprot:scaffold83036_cov39-Attheya_sp.AAC.3